MSIKGYVITLPNYAVSTVLTERCMTSGRKYGWDLELFEGVDGHKVMSDDEWDLYNIKVNKTDLYLAGYSLQPGARGCFFSHWMLWYTCVRLDRPIGIFEHDAVFYKPPPPTIPDDCDVLKLNRRLGLPPYDPRTKDPIPLPSGKCWEGACAYILKPSGAKKLIRWVHKYGMSPPDQLMAENVLTVEFDYNKRVDEEIGEISYVDNLPKDRCS